MPSINLDATMSDPLLLIAVVLLGLGSIVLAISLVQFIRLGGKKQESIDVEEKPEEEIPINAPPYMEEAPAEEPAPQKKSSPAPTQRTVPPDAMDKTVIMPSGTGEIQGQLEIAFSQIKSLNQKVYQLESEFDSLSKTAAAKLEPNELKEPPMDPADFTKKLLKLAEHVIVLEKEMIRVKTAVKNAAAAAAAAPANGEENTPPVESESSDSPPAPKAPIMPI